MDARAAQRPAEEAPCFRSHELLVPVAGAESRRRAPYELRAICTSSRDTDQPTRLSLIDHEFGERTSRSYERSLTGRSSQAAIGKAATARTIGQRSKSGCSSIDVSQRPRQRPQQQPRPRQRPQQRPQQRGDNNDHGNEATTTTPTTTTTTTTRQMARMTNTTASEWVQCLLLWSVV